MAAFGSTLETGAQTARIGIHPLDKRNGRAHHLIDFAAAVSEHTLRSGGDRFRGAPWAAGPDVPALPLRTKWRPHMD